jgi:hypothetical protein
VEKFFRSNFLADEQQFPDLSLRLVLSMMILPETYWKTEWAGIFLLVTS